MVMSSARPHCTEVGFSAIIRAARSIFSAGIHVTSAARSSVHSRVAS